MANKGLLVAIIANTSQRRRKIVRRACAEHGHSGDAGHNQVRQGFELVGRDVKQGVERAPGLCGRAWLPAGHNNVCVWDAQDIMPHGGLDMIEAPRGQGDKAFGRAHVFPPVVEDEESGQGMLPGNKAAVHGHGASAGREDRLGEREEALGVGIVQMMQHTYAEHQVKALCVFGLEGVYGLADESAARAPFLLGGVYVCLVRVESRIVHVLG